MSCYLCTESRYPSVSFTFIDCFGNLPDEGLRRLEITKAGTRITLHIATLSIMKNIKYPGLHKTRDSLMTSRDLLHACSFFGSRLNWSLDFFVVHDASLVLAALRFTLGEEFVEVLAAWDE